MSDKQIPQNPAAFGYRADAKVILTGNEFIVLQHLAQKAIGNGVTETYVQVDEWVNIETGEPVEKPTSKQINDGKVRRLPSKPKTLQNKQIAFNSNLYPEIFDGNEVVFNIHMRNIEQGIATPVEVLQKELEERQREQANKGQMTVVQDEVPQEVVEVAAESSEEKQD